MKTTWFISWQNNMFHLKDVTAAIAGLDCSHSDHGFKMDRFEK